MASPPQWESSYSGLALRPADSLPADLHERVRAALHALQRRGCLFRDLVRIRGRDVFTAVSRSLLGRPGDTYRYLGTRLFALPWHSAGQGAEPDACCDRELRDACRALWELNEFFCEDVGRGKAGGSRGADEDPPGGQGSSKADAADATEEEAAAPAPPRFNITLLNYMDPAAMNDLKEEPYYGMGKMAVSWHHDENLVPLSPVAVYNYSCPDEKGRGGGTRGGENRATRTPLRKRSV